jgi:SHS2 domain-containing protein
MGRLRYRQLEHTSDLKVEVFGDDLPELFRSAAECVSSCMLGDARVGEARTEHVGLAAAGPAELFLDWLRELLYLFSVKGMAIARADIARLGGNGEWRLEARVSGEDYSPDRHGLVAEIKAPTYHDYAFEMKPGACRAVVVFDV